MPSAKEKQKKADKALPKWKPLKKMVVPGYGRVFYKNDYARIFADISSGVLDRADTYRKLCTTDLFFLLVFGLQRFDANKPFIVMMCQQVESGPQENTLDLWAREHYKSTVITYAKTIQDVIRNPEIRIGIFSHTRPIAKAFLRQIKQTLEADVPVKRWFPDIFFDRPDKQSPKWSEDDGIQVIRESIAKEATIEAWGVVKGQPVSRHFDLMVFDDVVTLESVTSPDMLAKTSEAMQIAVSLGTDGGSRRYVGTHYHFADFYMELRERVPKENQRIRPATGDGTLEGEPVMLSPERLAELRREQGPYVFSCQQLLNPIDPTRQAFQWSWVRTYQEIPDDLLYIALCDPANSKKKGSDFTAMGVVAIDVKTWNRFLVWGIYEHLDLNGRWSALRNLFARFPMIKRIGYEQYGLQADIEHFETMQKIEGCYLPPIIPLGGAMAKEDRIRRLVGPVKDGRFFIPPELNVNGVDILKILRTEMETFPFSTHDDFLDMLARSEDDMMKVNGEPIFSPATIENLQKDAKEPRLRYIFNSNLHLVADDSGPFRVWDEPVQGVQYIAAVVPQRNHYGASAITVVAGANGRMVAQFRGNLPDEILAAISVEICKRYNGAWLVPDTGHSALLMQAIFAHRYHRVYAETEIVPPNKPRPRYGFKCEDKMLSHIMQAYAADIRCGDHGLPCYQTIAEMAGVRVLDDGKGAIDTGYCGERIISFAIARQAKRTLPGMILPPGGVTASSSHQKNNGVAWGAFT